MAEGKKPPTEIKVFKTAARHPRLTTALLLTGIFISISVAVAVGYSFIRGTVIILAGVFLSLLIRLGYLYEWTGFGEANLLKSETREVRPEESETREVRPKKTMWDWMDLLIVPLVIALVTVAFTLYQGQLEDQRAAQQRQIEEDRAAQQRQIEARTEEQRAQDAALQDYRDQMGNLLVNKDRPLRQSKEGDEVRTLARARTVTVLERMDPSRKGQIVRFLSEADLVQRVEGQPIIGLEEANLDGAYLGLAVLKEADLEGANLRGADLDGTNLSDAVLEGSHLSYAYLRETYLGYNADLREADLRNADLEGALGITKEQLEKQAKNLQGATMPDGSKRP